MRVLMLSWEYPPHIVGGLGSHVADLVPALDRAGVEITVVTPRWKGGVRHESLPGGGQVHRVDPPVAELSDFLRDVQATNASLQSVAQAVIEATGPFDVIHVHDWLVAFAGIALKHFYRIGLLATMHATERGRTGGGLHNPLNVAINGNEWWLCYEAWRIITTSHYMATQVEDYFQAPWDKIDIVPNGVYSAPFDVLPERGSPAWWQFRRRFAADHERLVYHVGRLVGEKGSPLIVAAAPAVLARVPTAKFVIAGRGPLLASLQQRATELGLMNHFYFTGFIPDDDRNMLYRVADVAVFPSLYEPFGIVALEAMAARTPVVVAASGGLAEVVEHDVTGVHTYPDNAASLAWGLNHALVNPELASEWVRTAYQRVHEVFNWDLIARQTAGVYRRIAAERAAAEW